MIYTANIFIQIKFIDNLFYLVTKRRFNKYSRIEDMILAQFQLSYLIVMAAVNGFTMEDEMKNEESKVVSVDGQGASILC